MYDTNKLLNFRKQKDEAWKNDKELPLTEEQKKNFKGLNYFPPNPSLSFELELDKNIPNAGKEIRIKTTGGDEQVYLKAGKILSTRCLLKLNFYTKTNSENFIPKNKTLPFL